MKILRSNLQSRSILIATIPVYFFELNYASLVFWLEASSNSAPESRLKMYTWKRWTGAESLRIEGYRRPPHWPCRPSSRLVRSPRARNATMRRTTLVTKTKWTVSLSAATNIVHFIRRSVNHFFKFSLTLKLPWVRHVGSNFDKRG